MARATPTSMTRGLDTLVRLVLAAILFAAFNVIVGEGLRGARIDLTEDKLYTLSDGSRQVLAELAEPVTVELYFSEKASAPSPQLFRYGKRVADLLREFERAADGKFRLRFIDPEPFSEAEDEAVANGLQGVPTSGGETLYLGLVITDLTDQRTVMPFLSTDREAFLEYDIAKTLYALSQPAKPKLALLTSLPLQYGPGGIMAFLQGQGRPYVIYEQLQQFFDIEALQPSFTAIPADTDALLIIHPPALAAGQLYAIDQFVLAGGRAMVFVDPFSEEAAASAAAAAQQQMGGLPPQVVPETSSLGPLFAAWGIDYDGGVVVADLEIAQRVNMGGGRPIRDYVIWLGASKANLNRDDVVAGSVSNLNLATAGALAPANSATTTFLPLLTSSQVSGLIPVDAVRGQPDPDQLIRDLTPDGQQRTLIARLSGPAKSAYPDGPPVAEDSGEGPSTDHLAEGRINILVGADSDMFSDRFWVQVQNFLGQTIATPIADNGAFIVSAVDHMVGSEALISLRSRRVSERPFHAVDRIRQAAEARFLDEEKRLQEELEATEQRIASLESGQGAGAELLTPEQQAEIENFRSQMLETRKQLRQVQRNLRRDIDALGTWVTVINVIGVPLVLSLIWIGVAVRRSWYRG